MGNHLSARVRKITFEKWIDLYGINTLASRLGVTVQTVYYWKLGHCDPRACYMRRIRKLSRGAITYEQMIDRGPLTQGRA